MIEKLLEFKRDNLLCEIYSNIDDTSRFIVGYIRACIGEYIIIEMFDQYGHYDGIGCFFTGDIFRVETDSEYLNAMNKLIANYADHSKYNLESINTFDKFYSLIQCDHRVCEIELCGSDKADVVGFIKSIDKDIIEISVVEQYGNLKGVSFIRKDMISSVSFDSCDTTKLEILQKTTST